MATFAFTARDESGNSSSGTLIASSVAEAGQMLRAEGKYPISVTSANQLDSAAARAAGGATFGGAGGIKISRSDLIQLSQQLAVMIETGVTVTEALDCIAGQI